MAAPTVAEPEAAPAATPELEAASQRAEARRGFLIALPSYVYLVLLFVIPLILVFVYSFATRDATGQTVLEGWNLGSYRRLFSAEVLEIFLRSLLLATVTTIVCLALAYPFAFYIATRRPAVRNVLLVLVMIPF
jgi:spermidine/putrescine transport system permease protein